MPAAEEWALLAQGMEEIEQLKLLAQGIICDASGLMYCRVNPPDFVGGKDLESALEKMEQRAKHILERIEILRRFTVT